MILHQEPAKYGAWLKLVFIIPIGLFIGAAVSAYYQELEAALFLIGEGAFFVLLFYLIMPRRYEIYQDRLRIVLGPPFGINIPLSTIKEVRHSSGVKAFMYSGIRFATSTKYVVEIVRNRGFNYVISPQNGDLFLDQLTQAIKSLAR